MSMPRAGYSAISSYSRVEILALVQARPERTIAELAELTRLHPNTVREHLQRLIEAGHVLPSIEHRTRRGRPRTLYSAATGTGHASSPIARRKVKEAADRGDVMRRVMPWTGRGVARLGEAATHQLDAIVEHLAESGFDPAVDEERLTIELSPCPHAASQADHRETLCAVHLGLMQAVLTEAGGPLQAGCIRTSVRPTDCTVELVRS
ncbi:winged helix-turn-helix transcriptional regulator [Microbacterium sp. NPDC064584]|uniref:winged helix-turn-helix transcriptional regulator n=1 Tax=Microbacterium sp. NPDC064584 TaxID=3155817 RepID=UPI00341FB223